MSRFYIKTRKGADAQGPFTAEQLKALAARGRLKPHYLVSKDGQTWYLAENIKDLPRLRQATGSSARPKAPRRPNQARRPAQPPAAGAPVSAVVALAAEVEAVRREGPAQTKRFPVGAVAGVVIGLAAAGVGGYLLFGRGGKGTSAAGANDSALAAKSPDGARASPQQPAPMPGPGPAALGPSPSPSPPVRRAPEKPAPVPRPDGRAEPARTPRSFQVLSVTYGGQVVQAMGSELTFHLTNQTGKAMQSLQGSIRLYDDRGGYLIGLPVKLTGPIQPGARVPVIDVWMELDGTIYGLLDRASKQMAFRFAADRVTYEDGTTETLK